MTHSYFCHMPISSTAVQIRTGFTGYVERKNLICPHKGFRCILFYMVFYHISVMTINTHLHLYMCRINKLYKMNTSSLIFIVMKISMGKSVFIFIYSTVYLDFCNILMYMDTITNVFIIMQKIYLFP